jgi:nucleotide-binding universal stress UspA family protein
VNRVLRGHKNILAALDGSESSFHALAEAIRLARWNKGRVSAMAVTPTYEGDLSLVGVGVGDIEELVRGSGGEILAIALEMAEASDARLATLQREGELHEKILEHAEAEGADLIVLGAGREYSLARAFLGASEADTVRFSRKDVLIIPYGATVGWERILLVNANNEVKVLTGEEGIEADRFARKFRSLREIPAIAVDLGVQMIAVISPEKSKFPSLRQRAAFLKLLCFSPCPVLFITGAPMDFPRGVEKTRAKPAAS